MSRRIDIELTSRRDDGSWTWRAPGAKEPRGSLDGSLLPEGAQVGDVLRAEADFEIDGIFVTSVQAPSKTRDQANETRLEILGSRRDHSGGVSVTMAPGRRRRPEEPGAEPERRGGPKRDRTTRPDGAERRPGRGRPRDREGLPGKEDGGDRRRERTPSRARTPEGTGRGEGLERADRAADSRTRAQRSREASKERRGGRRRMEPVTTHRNEALASLRPEQLPVAEQLLRGGIPAVRQAIDEQIQRSRAEGRTEISAEPLMAMAEQLLPVLNLATWKDRAVTVRNAGRDAPLREMRSVVSAASSVNLDEDARNLLGTLRETLDARVTALRDTWLGRINGALEAGRVTEALRVSARPPEPGARLLGDLAVRLAGAASAAMSPDCESEQWQELLDAVVESPVRRNVKPAGLPTGAGDELINSARRAAGFVPELARLLGLPIPPPPGPRRPAMAGGRRG